MTDNTGPSTSRWRQMMAEIGYEINKAQHAVLDGMKDQPSRSRRAIVAALREYVDRGGSTRRRDGTPRWQG